LEGELTNYRTHIVFNAAHKILDMGPHLKKKKAGGKIPKKVKDRGYGLRTLGFGRVSAVRNQKEQVEEGGKRIRMRQKEGLLKIGILRASGGDLVKRKAITILKK